MIDGSTSSNALFPLRQNPYYVVAPRYSRKSAGVKALHLLCHSLNRIGKTAYVVTYPDIAPAAVSPDLLTPILSQQVIDHHYNEGLTPIVVCPEVISGNPLAAPFVVRYVLNFPGLLGGDRSYPRSELLYGYSKVLAEAVGVPDNVLFVPTVDTSVFYPPVNGCKRHGSCYYAAKYRSVEKGPLFEITRNSVEITREGTSAPGPKEIAALFRRSEVFYTYENTALALEAVLCGCPVVCLPTPQLTELIGVHELGLDGYAIGTDPAEFARASASVNAGRENYLKLYDTFWKQLHRFVQQTGRAVLPIRYDEKIRLGCTVPSLPPPVLTACTKAWKKPWKRALIRGALRIAGNKVRPDNI